MSLFRIESRDPLIFRDGRPNDGRSESRTLPFPVPSALVGAIRTILGRSGGAFDASKIPALLEKVSLRGPLLAHKKELFVPAPGDALLLKGEDDVLHLQALHPIGLPPGARCSPTTLQLVGLDDEESVLAKPYSEAPKLWNWTSFADWLRDARPRQGEEVERICKLGKKGLPREERIHVAIGPEGTAEDGKLFAAEGLRLLDEDSWEDLSFLIDLDVQDPALGSLTPGLRPLGGERRLARWSSEDPPPFPEVPDWLLDHVRREESPVVRVIFLTPAYVASSVAPGCLNTSLSWVIAAKVDRPRTLSGWDMSKNLPHGQPKKTRRLAAEGSVYWVRLSGDAATRVQWVKDRWMQNLGDDAQLCRDGFGLAAIGLGRSA
ncbi:MAG: CRISPR-associated protein Cas5 [Myxococcales bacterium]|nr:type III-B CRISPR module-associated protein Cmr3 [Polyangiaceae bacterium]MDW8250184.1 CRISPR-associated protein Cas5 [Myxococcales bacterium]